MATTFPALVFFLSIFLAASASAAAELWYIDCGNSEGFTSVNNMTWLGDGDFVRSGESYKIRDGNYSGTTWETLRAFPEKKKNCYTIPTGKDRKIQVIAQFYYGNYDNKSKPPSFELLLDSNDWATVNIINWVESGVQYNTIYVTRSNNTNICLGRLYDDQDPFISAIKVSVLDPRLYSRVNSSYALYRPERAALGANASFRYPDDRYDRSWQSIEDSNVAISKYAILKGNTSVVNTSTSIDDPPAKMFSNAVTSLEPSKNLTITTSFLSTNPRPIYLNMYFTEISSSLNGSEQRRSFHIYKDDNLISDPITPPFGEVLEFTSTNLQATQNTSFTLVPVNGSTLPPIISGFEVMQVTEFSLASTNYQDVNALSRLQGWFTVLQNWTGDPCLPPEYNWEWVNCSSNNTPRITSLSLGGYGLQGSLPDFSELDALETIDLHNNSLNGIIPEFLSGFPNLRTLNLAYNNFSSIPSSLSSNSRINLNVTGNPLLKPNSAPPNQISGRKLMQR